MRQWNEKAPWLTPLISYGSLGLIPATQALVQFAPWGEATEPHIEMPCIVWAWNLGRFNHHNLGNSIPTQWSAQVVDGISNSSKAQTEIITSTK